jgi:hypothetical protein
MGVVIEIIWNYLPIFFVVLRMYSVYSNYICISSILNMRFESLYAAIIIFAGFIMSNMLTTIIVGGQNQDLVQFISTSIAEAKIRLLN